MNAKRAAVVAAVVGGVAVLGVAVTVPAVAAVRSVVDPDCPGMRAGGGGAGSDPGRWADMGERMRDRDGDGDGTPDRLRDHMPDPGMSDRMSDRVSDRMSGGTRGGMGGMGRWGDS